MVHARPGISDNLDTLGKEFVAVLFNWSISVHPGKPWMMPISQKTGRNIPGQTVQGTIKSVSFVFSSYPQE